MTPEKGWAGDHSLAGLDPREGSKGENLSQTSEMVSGLPSTELWSCHSLRQLSLQGRTVASGLAPWLLCPGHAGPSTMTQAALPLGGRPDVRR